MSDRMGCVYALADPRTSAIRYIGRTIQPVERRYREHWLYYCPNDLVLVWFKELRSLSLQPELRVLEEAKSTDLVFRERHWIAWALEQGEPLLNALIYRRRD